MKMGKNLYDSSHARHLKELKDYAPKQLEAFESFNDKVFQEGALTLKEKEIIAVAIAHVTTCPYCIDIHTKNAKEQGASLAELTEAVFVTSAIEAGGVITHGSHAHLAYEGEEVDSLYSASNLKYLDKISEGDPKGFKGYQTFAEASSAEGELSHKLKEIISVAVGHATLCPYCIKVHVTQAKKAGASKEEIDEAVLVTAALKAGSSYAHLSNMIESYQN